MAQIALVGVVGVVIYLITHFIVMRIEAWRNEPLGPARMVVFFVIFFVLLLGAFEVIPLVIGQP
jgi:hypothetical protein